MAVLKLPRFAHSSCPFGSGLKNTLMSSSCWTSQMCLPETASTKMLLSAPGWRAGTNTVRHPRGSRPRSRRTDFMIRCLLTGCGSGGGGRGSCGERAQGLPCVAAAPELPACHHPPRGPDQHHHPCSAHDNPNAHGATCAPCGPWLHLGAPRHGPWPNHLQCPRKHMCSIAPLPVATPPSPPRRCSCACAPPQTFH